MNAFHRLEMRHQVAAVIVLAGAAALVALTVFQVYKHAQRSVAKAQTELLGVAAMADAHIREYFTDATRDVETFARDPRTVTALVDFADAYRALGAGAMADLQSAWIDRNPNPAGQKQAQIDSGRGDAYDRAHVAHHLVFEGVQQRGDYYDVFLIDRDLNLVYSYFKERDFATPLGQGDLADSGLARAARDALQTGGTVLTPFAPYAPSSGADAAFIAHPVRDAGGAVIGVIAVQVPVGPMAAALELARPAFVNGLVLLDASGTVRATASAPGSWNPVAGSSASLLMTEPGGDLASVTLPDGHETLVVVAPVDVPGLPLQVAAIGDAEVLSAEIRDLSITSMLLAAATLVGLALIGILFGSRMARPIAHLLDAIGELQKGNLSFDLRGTDRGDEIGALARAVGRFRDQEAGMADLRKRQVALGAACDSVSAALMMVDRDMTITFMNAAAVDLMQKRIHDFRNIDPDFDPTKLVGRCIDVFHKGAEKARIRGLLENTDLMPMNAEIRIGRALLQLKVSQIAGDDGMVIEWIDATDTVIQTRMYETSNANQFIVEFGPDWSVVGMNRKFTQSTGHVFVRHPAVRGQDLIDVSGLGLGNHAEVMDMLASEGELTGRFGVHSVDGERLLVLGTMTLVRDTKERPYRIVLVGRDITLEEAARTEAAAERDRAQAEQQMVVENLKRGLAALSAGDLTVSLDTAFPGTYEVIRQDFNRMAANLCRSVQGVAENAAQIQGETSAISAAAESLAQRTEKQASTLEETASALDEITKSVAQSSDRATRADGLVTDALKATSSGSKVVLETVAAMDAIEASSRQISRITSVIDDIAFQTNLLALNAGVEAARAGDAGRGFAVVASEVRALAQRSSAAAREISGLIADSGSQVTRGVALAGQAGEALRGIEVSFTEIAHEVAEISMSSKTQSAGLVEINAAMSDLDQVTQQNAAMFEETSAASHALRQESAALLELIRQFRIDDAPVIGARPEAAHRATGMHPAPRKTDPVPTFRRREAAPIPSAEGRSSGGWTNADAVAGSGPRAATATAVAVAAAAPEPPRYSPAVSSDGWEDF
ncbi:MAG: methyl-accepting chemotaxis protein [Rhodobacteraceae bacterium]|nr:methyl-accepting chemotaxis protein [Paracoccaceae bacterium]